jgi:hypothetical protein
MDDIREQAYETERNDHEAADRERQYRKDEDNWEDTDSHHPDPEQLAERAEAKRDELRGDGDIARYEAEQERNTDHANDGKV